MKTATGNSVLRAYNKAVKKLTNREHLIASSTSAGFIIPDGETKGIQVFVNVYRFDKVLLKKKPETGGLLCRHVL